jgi:hypothetical protein
MRRIGLFRGDAKPYPRYCGVERHRAQFIAPDHDGATNSGAMNRAPTVGEIIRAFKARCTHGINQLRKTQGALIWQRNYYEHIIRSESSLQETREYIANNLAQWPMTVKIQMP